MNRISHVLSQFNRLRSNVLLRGFRSQRYRKNNFIEKTYSGKEFKKDFESQNQTLSAFSQLFNSKKKFLMKNNGTYEESEMVEITPKGKR